MHGIMSLLLLLLSGAGAAAGPGQYDFLIGDWDVAVTLQRQGQEPLEYQAKWHNHWMAEGNLVAQEWHGPYAEGLELRSYDAERDEWQGRNIYFPEPHTWYENTAVFKDGEMTVTTVRVAADGTETITREIYHDIEADSFRIRTERSTDGGKSWEPGRYSAVVTRAVSSP